MTHKRSFDEVLPLYERMIEAFMEIELKYLIPDYDTAGKMWQQKVFERYGKIDSIKRIEMSAVYFDTADFILSDVETAFRIRKEGDKVVATVKWGGYNEECLHEREEINIPLASSYDLGRPSLHIFNESKKGQELIQLVGDRELVPIMETDFIRNTMYIDTGKAICEAAMDVGKIVTHVGNEDIIELEIELFSGDLKEIISIGKELQNEFGLIPGEISKFGRGLELLKRYN